MTEPPTGVIKFLSVLERVLKLDEADKNGYCDKYGTTPVH